MDKKKKKQIVLIGLIVLAVIIGLILSVKALIGIKSDQADGPLYSTAEAVKGDIQVGVKAKGMLQPTYGGEIQVSEGRRSWDMPSVNFVVDEVLVKEGDPVTQGQLIMKLASPDLESTLDTQKDTLDSLLTELSDMSGKPKSEVEGINPARGIVLSAPIDGRVIDMDLIEGATLEVGRIIATIVDDSKFRVKARFTTGEVAKVKKGSKVLINFHNFDGTYEGTISSISSSPIPVSDNETGFASGYAYVAYITGENPGLIQEDMNATIGLISDDGQGTYYCKYNATVDGFMEEEKILNKVDDTIVTDVHVDGFELVKKGDPIVTLSGDDMQDKIRQKLEQVRQLRRTISQLEEQFNYLEVRSTINGIVSNLDVEAGKTVSPWDWLGNIYNTDRMMLWIQVDDIDIVNVVQGAPVSVTVDAMSGTSFEGTVMNVSSHGNQSGGVTKYDVNVEVSGGEGLRPGMQATAYIDSGSAEDVLIIPIEAVFDENGEEMVEVLEDGVPKLTKVTLGLMNDRFAEVLEGLEEGQLVITGSSSDMLPSEHIQADDALIPSGNNSDENDSTDGE